MKTDAGGMMPRRYQFSLAKLFTAVTLICLTTFFLSELMRSCRAGSVSVCSYFAFCGMGGCTAALWTMFRETPRDALSVGVMFFVLAVFALPLIFIGLWGLSSGLRSLLSL